MKQILHVDDSETMRQMVRMCLASEFEVDLASDGEEGVAKFKGKKYDAVIADVNMPKMNGIEMIREIRKTDQNVVILMLTTESEDSMRKQGVDAGANGWLVKPFKPTMICGLIKQAIS
jgi:two-component system chemotaxis response regulator CheY